MMFGEFDYDYCCHTNVICDDGNYGADVNYDLVLCMLIIVVILM